MSTPESPSIELMLNDVDAVIRSAVRQKLRVSLRANDFREQNLDGLDILGDIRLKLIRKLSGDYESLEDAPLAPGIQQFTAYAATVAYRTCSDYLRAKYPVRTSLKNCLRRILDKAPEFAAWPSSQGEMLSGYAGWKNPSFATSTDSARILDLRADPYKLPPSALPSGSIESMRLPEWKTLLEAVFNYTEQPTPLDDLIAIVAPIVGREDIPDTYQDGEGDEPDREFGTLASREPGPESVWLTSQRLKLYWGAVLKLLVWHRSAYLLNNREGDLEALPLYGVATLVQIGDALELTEKHFSTLTRELQVNPAIPKNLAGGSRFIFYWQYLPLEDNIIASVLEVTRAQVISYRSKAKDRLKRMLQGEL